MGINIIMGINEAENGENNNNNGIRKIIIIWQQCCRRRKIIRKMKMRKWNNGRRKWNMKKCQIDNDEEGEKA